MEKVLTIGGIDCTFKTSAALPRIYRMKFKRDIFIDLTRVGEAIEKAEKNGTQNVPPECLTVFENIAYTMHKYGDNTQPNSVEKWLDQFSTFDIYLIFPHIAEMWAQENGTLVESKKKINQ